MNPKSDVNNNDMSERRQGAFGMLDLLTEHEMKQTRELNEIGQEIESIQKQVHQMEIDRLNRQHKSNLEDIAAAVEEYLEKTYLTTDEELDEIRKLILQPNE